MFPRDTYKINDNSVVRTSTSANKGPVFFQAYNSDKGIDNKIIVWDKYDEWLEANGRVDISKHGQAQMQAANILENGGILCGIRLTDRDATYSNVITMLNIRLLEEQKTNAEGEPLYSDEVGNETTEQSGNTPIMIKKAKVKTSLKAFERATTDAANLQTLMRTLYKEPSEGVNDCYEIPLFGIVCAGRGKYGNDFRFKLENNLKGDRSNKNRVYTFTLLSNESGLHSVGPSITVSNSSDAIDAAGRSIGIQDSIRINFKDIVASVVEDYQYKLVDMLLPIVQQEDPGATANDIDTLHFRNKMGAIYKYVEIEPESVDISQREGLGFINGSDGGFDRTSPEREDKVNARLVELFEGKIDPLISNIDEIAFRIALDACYPLEVKKAMVGLLERRKMDFELFLDGSLIFTPSNIKTFLSTELGSINGQELERAITVQTMHHDTVDKYSGKIVTVTMNYALSIMLPKHILESGGPHKPLAGINYPLDAYIIEGSLMPQLGPKDGEEIYELGGNYVHRRSGHYIFASCITFQKIESDLSYTHNMLVLNNMLADIRYLSEAFRYRFNDSDEDYKALNKEAELIINPYEDIQCKIAKVVVSPNPNDISGKSVKTKLSVGFKDFILSNHVETDINF